MRLRTGQRAQRRPSVVNLPPDELRIRAKNGEYVAAEATWIYIEFEGKPATLSFIRDMRQRKKEKEERGKCDANRAVQEKETFGTARSAASSISKNGACLNANHDAMMLDGTCSIITLKSRTVPL